jgi:hypothetical protein
VVPTRANATVPQLVLSRSEVVKVFVPKSTSYEERLECVNTAGVFETLWGREMADCLDKQSCTFM